MRNQLTKSQPNQVSDGLLAEGFSLIELIVAITVLSILSSLGIFAIVSFINDAKFIAAKASLTDAAKSCMSNTKLNLYPIPDVRYSNLGSSGDAECGEKPIVAEILDQCCLSIDTNTMEKNLGKGWPKDLSSCGSCREIQAAANPHPEGPECDWDWVPGATRHDGKWPPLNCGTLGFQQCLPETCSYKYEVSEKYNDHGIKLVYMDEKGGTCRKEQFHLPVQQYPLDYFEGADFDERNCIEYINTISVDISKGYERFLQWQNAGGKLGKTYKNNYNVNPQISADGKALRPRFK